MPGNPEADKLSRADLVAAAVERNREIWVRMARRITADGFAAEALVRAASPETLLKIERIKTYITDAAGIVETLEPLGQDAKRAEMRFHF